MSKHTPKKPRLLHKVCPICGTHFTTYVTTPYKREIKKRLTYYCSPDHFQCLPERDEKGPTLFVGNDLVQNKDIEASDPWCLLAFGILALAIDDYKSVLRKGKVGNDTAETRPLTSRSALEAFFRSEWAEDLALGLYSSEQMFARLHAMQRVRR